VVTRLKKDMSDFSAGQGSWSRRPMPRGGETEVATMRYMGRDRMGGIEVTGGGLGFEGRSVGEGVERVVAGGVGIEDILIER
jgi:hypothetical protein